MAKINSHFSAGVLDARAVERREGHLAFDAGDAEIVAVDAGVTADVDHAPDARFVFDHYGGRVFDDEAMHRVRPLAANARGVAEQEQEVRDVDAMGVEVVKGTAILCLQDCCILKEVDFSKRQRRQTDRRGRNHLLPVVALFLPFSGSVVAQPSASETAVRPLPAEAPAAPDNPTTPGRVALGRRLFFEPRLSGDNTMSCATCHDPAKAFGDGLPVGKGANGKPLSRNTQSLLNVAFYSSYFWDGRALTLEEQALGPIRAPDEMNQDLDELVRELNSVPAYVQEFRSVFGTAVTQEGIARALAAFQRTLVTRNSPFDRFLAGETNAMSDQAREGWLLFRDAGCIRCHNGSTLSDGKFYRLGVDFRDRGRGAVTGENSSLYAFRTPGLRDVALTAPYMHNGSLATLEDVVQFYFRSTSLRPPENLTLDFEPLIGRSFSEIAPIVAFLEALTGEPGDRPAAGSPNHTP